MATPITGLVDPDPRQIIEQVNAHPALVHDAREYPADTAPRDPHQLGDHTLSSLGCKPSDLVFKHSRVPRVAGPGPRHPRGDNAVLTAPDPRRISLQPDLRGTRI